MATSPTPSVKSREMIGLEAFSKRRDVFGRHDTVFFPAPLCLTPAEFARATGTGVSQMRRTPAYSSMRETRRDIRNEIGFRERKMSDFTSEMQSKGIDYRQSLAERSDRISKLRRDFLASNFLDSNEQFTRVGTRASMPSRNHDAYKIPVTSIYKFPFAQPYGTPPPTRKLVDTCEVDGEIDEAGPRKKTNSLSNSSTPMSLSELMKRYSLKPKPFDMTIPPTKPRVISTVSKSNSEGRNAYQNFNENLKILETDLKITENDPNVMDQSAPKNKVEIVDLKIDVKYSTSKTSDTDKINITDRKEKDNTQDSGYTIESGNANKKDGEKIIDDKPNQIINSRNTQSTEKHETESARIENNSPEKDNKSGKKVNESKPNGYLENSSDETNGKDDKFPEMPKILKQNSSSRNAMPNDTIPAILDKIEKTNTLPSVNKKAKLKRSFLDKLLKRNRNKDKKK